MLYGCVVLESLNDPQAVAGWTPVVERVSNMPDDPEAKVWHVRWYHLRKADVAGRLGQLSAAMRPQWYAHFWRDDELYVILAGRAFRLSASDRSTWAPMLAYGDKVGIDRKWTETIPTTLPAYVQDALAAQLYPLFD